MGIIVQDPEAVPEGGYGWVCVVCVFLVNACTWGVAASYGVFLSYYLTTSTFSSATSLDYAFIGGLEFGCSLSLATPVTIITRRFGIHIPMLAGIFFQTAGFILASFTSRTAVWQLYLTQGALVGVGIGFTYLPAVVVPSQWFEKKRSLANGIVSSGSGIGGIVFSFAAQATMEQVGVPWALRMVGIVSGAVNLIAVALVRSRNREVQAVIRGFDVALLKRENVLLLLAWAFLTMLGYVTPLYSLSAYAKDQIGLSDSQASVVTACLNLGFAIGRPLMGLVSDWYGRIEVAGLSTFFSAVCIFAIWIPSNSYGVLIFFAIISGLFLGVLWVTISPLCVEVAGIKDLNSLLALAWATIVLPCTFSEVIALKIRRPNTERPFLYPQIFSGLSYLVAAGIMFRLWQVQHRKRLTDF